MSEDNIIKTKTYMLKELNYLNNWLKFRNPKKITIRANDLLDEYKLLKSSILHLLTFKMPIFTAKNIKR